MTDKILKIYTEIKLIKKFENITLKKDYLFRSSNEM